MKKLLLMVFSLVIVFVGGGVWLGYSLTPASADKTVKRFVIDPGEVANQIGVNLASAHIIKSALAFRIYSQVTQAARNIKPGSYELTADASIPQIINKLLAGPTEIWVTVPEGLRREEAAQKFTSGLELSGKPADQFYNTFLALTVNDEGYLFPDTYLVAKDVTPTVVVKTMLANFDLKYAEALKMKKVDLSKDQIVTLASIVQREAITADDMRGVASVLLNRYRSGMMLGSDVTLEYALGYQQSDGTWWKKDLTADDLLVNSPYNTRVNLGFPPTPISNPGLTALEAAINPPQTDYFYYLSDSNGKLHFAKTLDEHNANIAKYLQ